MGILVRNNKVISAGGKILYSLAGNPFELPNLKLYLSATRMVQQADESSVSSFADFSGNSFHATQGTSGFQPKFDLNQFGSNAGIRINNGKYLESNPLVLANTNQFTVQILAKRHAINISSYPFTMPDANNTDSLFGFGWAGAGYAICFGKRLTSDLRTDIQFPSNDLNQHLIQMTLNPTDAKVYVYFDGILKGTFQFTVGIMETPLKFLIGSTYGLTGSEVNVNGITVNQSYSDHATIQAQYRGYLQRGYL